jgi:hypothetical protein
MDGAPAAVRCPARDSLAIPSLVARFREQSAAPQQAAVYREPSAAQQRVVGSHEQFVAQQRARAYTDLQQDRVGYRLREDCGHRLGVPDADLLPDCRLHHDDR